jgi:hypothetical protein
LHFKAADDPSQTHRQGSQIRSLLAICFYFSMTDPLCYQQTHSYNSYRQDQASSSFSQSCSASLFFFFSSPYIPLFCSPPRVLLLQPLQLIFHSRSFVFYNNIQHLRQDGSVRLQGSRLQRSLGLQSLRDNACRASVLGRKQSSKLAATWASHVRMYESIVFH